MASNELDIKVRVGLKVVKGTAVSDINKVVSQLSKQVNAVKVKIEFDDKSSIAKLNTSLAALRKSLGKTTVNLLPDSYKTEIQGYEKKIIDLKQAIDNVVNNKTFNSAESARPFKTMLTDVQTLTKLIKEAKANNFVMSSSGYDSIVKMYKDLEKAATKYGATSESVFKKQSVQMEKIQINADKVITKFDKLFDKNPAILGIADSDGENLSDEELSIKQYVEQFRELSSIIMSIDTNRVFSDGEIKAYNAQLSQMNALYGVINEKAKGLQPSLGTFSFGANISKDLGSLFKYLVLDRALYAAGDAIKTMVNNVKQLDSAMVELRKVTDETETTYNRFLDKAADKAVGLAATVSDLTTTTAEFAKLGYSLNEAFELAQTATVYSNVGDLSVGDATKNIVSIMKSFNIEAKDSIQIVDMLNEVGNNFAISSGNLGSALEDSASALRSSNNTLAESMAIITAMDEITQDTSKTATAIRTLSARLRNTSVDLEAMGEDAEGAAATISELRSEVLAVSGVDIMKDDNTYKSTYQILDELADVWGNLSDTQQGALTKLIAGVRQYSAFNSVLINWHRAEEALETALNSSGSAAKENAAYIDSIQGKIKALESAIQVFSNNAIESSWVKGMIDFATACVTGANSVSALGTSLGLLFFAIELFKLRLPGATTYTAALAAELNILTVTSTGAKVALAGLAGVVIALGVAFLTKVVPSIIEYAKEAGILNRSLKEQQKILDESVERYNEQKDKVDELKESLVELRNTIDGVKSGELELTDGQTVENLEHQLALQQALYDIEQRRLAEERREKDENAQKILDTGGKTIVTADLANRGSVRTETTSLYKQFEDDLKIAEAAYASYIETVEAANNGDKRAARQLESKREAYNNAATAAENTYKAIADATGQLSVYADGYSDANYKLGECTDQLNGFYHTISNNSNNVKNVSDSIKQLSEDGVDLTATLTTLESSMDLLSDAEDEMAETGSLSLKTINSLLEAGKAELLIVDEETNSIRLNTQALKDQIVARVDNQIAIVKESIAENEDLIRTLENERKTRQLTTEEIYRMADARKLLAEQTHKVDILEATKESVFNDTGIASKAKTYENVALDNFKKKVAHREKMNQYLNKEEEHLKDLIYAYDKLCKTAEERQEIEEMIFDVQQDYNQRLADEYEKQQDALETMIEYAINMIKKQKEEEIDAIKETTEEYRKQYDMRKKALEKEKNEEDYENDLAEKQKAVTDLEAKITALQYDDSAEAAKKRLELEEDLAEAKKELDELQRERYFEEQEEALDEEMDRFEEEQDEKEKIIEDYLDDEGQIRSDAIKDMESDYNAFYKRLEEYCNKYEGSVSQDIKDAWDDAKTALDSFNDSQINVLGTLDDLIRKQKLLSEATQPNYYSEDDTVTSSGSGGGGGGGNDTTPYYAREERKEHYKGVVDNIVATMRSTTSSKVFDEQKQEAAKYIDSISNTILNSKLDDASRSFYKGLLEILKSYIELDFNPTRFNPGNRPGSAVLGKYLNGGIVDSYGLSLLHGDKKHSEVVFSSEDAKKLWEYVHGLPTYKTEMPSSLATRQQEINFGDIMPVTIEAGAVVNEDTMAQFNNLATKLKRELMDSLNKTGYRSNVASRRI